MKRFLGIVLFSIIEVAGLIIWLLLVDADPAVIDLLGLLGLVVLDIFLIVEHTVTDNLLHGRPLFRFSGLPLGEIVIFSTIETIIWGVWLVLADQVNPIVAVVFLVITLFFEHTISRNVHERDPLFSQIFDPGTFVHTVIESVACAGWLALVRAGQPIIGAIVLLVGSIIEHTIAVKGTKVPSGGAAGPAVEG